MTTLNWLLAIPVLVPFIGAAFALLLYRHPRIQEYLSVAALTLVMAVTMVIAWQTRDGTMVLDVGGWSAPVGISLIADRLTAIMLVVSVFVTLCVLIFSISQEVTDETTFLPVSVYTPTFLILSAGVSNAFLTGDLFNLYVGFEILLMASFVLITLGGTRDRIRSGTIYVIVSVLSSVVFLVGIAMVYASCGTLNLAQLALRLPTIDPGTSQLIEVTLLVAFGIKAAIFPLAAWLPDSYPTAPAPVTAVFAGLLTKVGVYAMIRTELLLFPHSQLRPALLVLGAISMIIGILGAIAQDDLKRLLSFTLVSHIGFMVWGIGLGSPAGIQATIFYTAHHIIVQTALFLVAGLIENISGSTSLRHLGSLAKTWPLLGILWMVPALNLAGIPPFSGFFGKLGLIQGSIQDGSVTAYLALTAGLICSLLTLYVMIKVWNMAFWQDSETPIVKPRISTAMTGSTIALIVGSLLLTVFARPLTTFTFDSAENLLSRHSYIVAVLPDYERGTGQSNTDDGNGSDETGLPLPTPTSTRTAITDIPTETPSHSPSNPAPVVVSPTQAPSMTPVLPVQEGR